jgi:hypothetical protein
VAFLHAPVPSVGFSGVFVALAGKSIVGKGA